MQLRTSRVHNRFVNLSVFLLIVGVGGCGDLLRLLPFFGACPPSNDRKPGCIHDVSNAPQQPLQAQHRLVLFIPGIGGTPRCEDFLPLGLFGIDVELSLEQAAAETLRVPPIDPVVASTQIWDWTKDLPGDYCQAFQGPDRDELVSRVYENDKTQSVASKLAFEIEVWSNKPTNADRKLTIVAGSGGALVTVLAAEMLPSGRKFFERVIFISAALSTERSLEKLNTITEHGIYNYYSYNDAILQGYICMGGNVIDFRWPAAGRFGYRANNPNHQFITAQLAWQPSYNAEFNNNGEHYNAYRKEFFRDFIRPVILGRSLPTGWILREDGGIDKKYTDGLQAADGESLLFGISPLSTSMGKTCVLIVPGHENSQNLFGVQNLINNDPGLKALIWDWTQATGVRSLDEAGRLEPRIIQRAAATLAAAIVNWQSANGGTPLHVVGVSSGTLITTLACDIQSGNKIADGSLESVLFTSGLVSTERPLDGVLRCSQTALYNYYSGANDKLVGTDFDCAGTCDANFVECITSLIYASIRDPVRWPAAGRYGYRGSERPADSKILQLGWTKQMGRNTSNNGTHLRELNRDFAETYFLSIWRGQPLSPEWSADVLNEYRDQQ